MRCAVAVSAGTDCETLERDLRGAVEAPCDLAILFFTAAVKPVAAALAQTIRAELEPRVFLGVSGEGVLGGDQEIERRPGAALWTASLPGVTLQPWRIGAQEWRGVLSDPALVQERCGAGPEHRGQLVLGDPFTTPVDALLERFDEALGARTFGGMASAAAQAGGNLLLLDDQIHFDGAVGVGFGGPLGITTVVSQGCRPIGEPLVATRTEGNAILELARRPALEVAETLLAGLAPADRDLLRHGLFVGVAMDEYRSDFRRGDFLIRGLMGVNREAGALVIADSVRPGQTVQFQLRDAATATEDLRELLAPEGARAAAGGLLFTCNGRGTRMFDQPHHDVRTAGAALPGVPLAGFFAMGELGPVGSRSYIHGHTASLALFHPLDTSAPATS
jgi:small ligand-binding sensory domain FIST